MIKIGILVDIGSGKSYVAQNFGYPVFNADYEVAQLYKKNKNVFNKLKKSLPKYISFFSTGNVRIYLGKIFFNLLNIFLSFLYSLATSLSALKTG